MDSTFPPGRNGQFVFHRRAFLWAFVALFAGCATWGIVRFVGPRSGRDADWQANALIRDAQLTTDTSVGAAQGVSRRGDRLYVYGDLRSGSSRVGVIGEYDLNLVPTGARIRLTRDGAPLIRHPTGLTWDDGFGCFLGDTVNSVGMIYRIDWERALTDGHLDRAVLTEIRDDAANNGSRPEFVTHRGQRFLASADYGDISPEMRLYDPRRLVAEKRSAAPGVLVQRFPCGPFNQSLAWDEATGTLTCIQNVVAGRGWRLDVIHLENCLDRQGVVGDARRRMLVFNRHDELEGYCALPEGLSIFVAASRRDNLVRGRIEPVAPFASPAGSHELAP